MRFQEHHHESEGQHLYPLVRARNGQARQWQKWRKREEQRGTCETTTSASPQQIWNILTDVTRIGEWSHECHSARWLDATTEAAPGVRFRGTSRSGIQRWSRTCTFTTVDEPRELAWTTHGGLYGDTTEWRYTLTPTPTTTTRITQTYRIHSLPVWFDRLIWLTNPAHHDRTEALRADLTRLAGLAEHPG
ncbi:SRPBCC family protein [Nocardia sp. 2]|uniref:SRPBCC family protein n=2 Tax=Nocardia acididurans TaxID=2802282 RepID=A0ABS1MHH5_9NOCA|nr:SRPBCC family protein [Nocardia acididurans]